MTSPVVYGDISPRTAAFAIYPLLKRGYEKMLIERFGQNYVLPLHSSNTAKWRRYEALAAATTPLTEGVTPTGSKPTYTDITVTLLQHGDFMVITDFVRDTHEDPILKEFSDLLMQQWTETIETLRWGIIKAGTNVGYSNGTARTDVNTPINYPAQQKATEALLNQRARQITKQLSSNPNFRTEPVESAFIALCHTNVERGIRALPGFIPTKQYGTVTPFPNEIGAVDNVRYIRSTLFTAFADAGGAKGAMKSTTGTSADVYPVIYLGEDAYGVIQLKGDSAMALIVHNPGAAGSSDPLNQRGTIGWKTMQNSAILNDLWMYRLEVAATA